MKQKHQHNQSEKSKRKLKPFVPVILTLLIIQIVILLLNFLIPGIYDKCYHLTDFANGAVGIYYTCTGNSKRK